MWLSILVDLPSAEMEKQMEVNTDFLCGPIILIGHAGIWKYRLIPRLHLAGWIGIMQKKTGENRNMNLLGETIKVEIDANKES